MPDLINSPELYESTSKPEAEKDRLRIASVLRTEDNSPLDTGEGDVSANTLRVVMGISDDEVQPDTSSITGNSSQNIDWVVTGNIKIKRIEFAASTQGKFEVQVNRGAGFTSIGTKFVRQQDPNQEIIYTQSLKAGDIIRIVKENNYVDAQSMYSYIYFNII